MLSLPINMLGTNVSRLGLGTVKIGRNQGLKYPAKFKLPDDKTVVNLFAMAQEAGINLLDTAPAYGQSEERLGQLIGKNLRHWIVISKAGEEFYQGQSHFDFSRQAVERSVTRSLKRLGRDYLDVLLIHSNGDENSLIEKEAIFITLENLKQAGVIRMGGISSKTVAGGIASLDYADCVMVTYNPTYLAEQPVLDHAAKLSKPVFIKKAFCSGHIEQIAAQDPIQRALEFIFSHPAPSHVIAGTINSEHLQHNINLCQ